MGIAKNGVTVSAPAAVGLCLILAFTMSGSDKRPRTTASQLEFAVSDDSTFTRLKDARPGEWRHEFREFEQSFSDYVKSGPVKPGKKRRVLVFAPAGPFPPEKRRLLEDAVKFAGIWFALPVRIESELPLPEKGYQRMNQFPWQKEPMVQYRTDYFLKLLLPGRMPEDAVAYMAFTMSDLYPDDSWNYVFGQASLTDRVGVYSIVRYFPEFWGERADSASARLAQKRIFKVLVHEAGHIFGLHHCMTYACVMNGSNSLKESDGRPLHLCPPCLKKLQWSLDFDVIDRYEGLLEFYEDREMSAESGWTRARLERIKALK